MLTRLMFYTHCIASLRIITMQILICVLSLSAMTQFHNQIMKLYDRMPKQKQQQHNIALDSLHLSMHKTQ